MGSHVRLAAGKKNDLGCAGYRGHHCPGPAIFEQYYHQLE
jgi:hypothetical protein